ncbi:hypothetical protein PINS_up014400 [Pythium insidiosum]|nr:hypothetical protein PINS_up014400 [Pythium insidiosum]
MASQQKRPCKPIDRLPLIVQPKFAGSSETPQFQFPCLQASKWEAPNQVVRALHRRLAALVVLLEDPLDRAWREGEVGREAVDAVERHELDARRVGDHASAGQVENTIT